MNSVSTTPGESETTRIAGANSLRKKSFTSLMVSRVNVSELVSNFRRNNTQGGDHQNQKSAIFRNQPTGCTYESNLHENKRSDFVENSGGLFLVAESGGVLLV